MKKLWLQPTFQSLVLLAALTNLDKVLAAEVSDDAANAPPAVTLASNAPPAVTLDSNLPPVLTLESPPPEHKNRLALSYRMGVNISVNFNKLGGFYPQSNPGPATGSTANRTYDNGYNKVDISTNAGGMTWYWGYQNANQIQGNTIVMDSSSSKNTGSANDNKNGPQNGLQLTYDRELYRDKSWRFGLEGSFGVNFVNVGNSSTVYTTVNQIQDAFTIPGGVFVIPSAPYAGTFQGPGPLMSSSLGTGTGVRTITAIPGASVVTGSRDLDANVYMIQLGPYAEVPLSKKFSLIFDGGLTLAFADCTISYRETVTIPGVGSETRSGSGSETDFLVGGYVGGAVSYAVTKEVSVFVGAQFQAAGRAVTDSQLVNQQAYTQKQATLNLSRSVVFNFGVAYSF